MASPIDLELLELALWHAYSKFVTEKPHDRPVRAPRKSDTTHAADLLQAVRNTWRLVKAKEISGTYEEKKRLVSERMRHERNWDLPTRNLYSSAVGVYSNWSRGGTGPAEELRKELKRVRAIGIAIQKEYDNGRYPGN